MNRQLHILQSDPEVPAGVFAALLDEWQIAYRVHRSDLGEQLPGSVDAVIVLGGRMGVHDEKQHPFLVPLKAQVKRLTAVGTPLLGLCLGGQLIAAVLGGVVCSNRYGEKGLVDINLSAAGLADPLFAGMGVSFQAFQWHDDSFSVPLRSGHLASSALCPGQAFRYNKAWGLQFHPEVDAATVTAWCKDSPERERLVGEFARGERAHYQQSRALLGNFLRISGWTVS